MYKGKILVTGGEGRFAKVLKEKNKLLNLHFATKKNCNILKLRSIENIVRKVKPKILKDQAMNPKKLGILTPFSSAIDFTIKFGAFPI